MKLDEATECNYARVTHPVRVTYTFELPEHEQELKVIQMASCMHSALWAIYNECRTASKHGDNEAVGEFADKINQMIWDYVDLEAIE